VSPLRDQRTLAALVDLHARGFDLAVLGVEPGEPAARTRVEHLALRLWRLRRQAAIDDLTDRGVPVVRWADGDSLAVAVGEVARWPRRTGATR
jgi:hypothetical protein